jgi:hypothetical protein
MLTGARPIIRNPENKNYAVGEFHTDIIDNTNGFKDINASCHYVFRSLLSDEHPYMRICTFTANGKWIAHRAILTAVGLFDIRVVALRGMNRESPFSAHESPGIFS